MTHTHLVLGGCRSGKSSHAQTLAEDIAENRLYIATCIPRDDEMTDRVNKHKAERGNTWHCIEAPIDIAGAIIQNQSQYGVILVDCITLWISNYLMMTKQAEALPDLPVTALVTAANNAACPVLFVSNEVGAGIVPENRLARQYRDLAGMVNQKLAAGLHHVTWMVAGIPVKIK